MTRPRAKRLTRGQDPPTDATVSAMLTVILLFVSNTFMTFAWYGT